MLVTKGAVFPGERSEISIDREGDGIARECEQKISHLGTTDQLRVVSVVCYELPAGTHRRTAADAR